MSLKDELEVYLSCVERETHTSLPRICRALKQSGLNFDDEFVERFLRFALNRVGETYDNFVIDAELHVQSNDRHGSKKRGNSGSDDMGKLKKIRSKSPSSASVSSSFRGMTGSNTNGTGYNQEQKRMGVESDIQSIGESDVMVNWRCMERDKLHTSTPKLMSNSLDGSMENGMKMKQLTDGNEQPNEKSFEEWSLHPNRFNEFDENRSLDSGVASNGTSAFCLSGPVKLPRALTFTCYHCSPEADSNCQCYNDIEAVYAHWMASHQDDKAFKFYLIERVTCYFCGIFGTYKEVVDHQKQEHANEPKVIVVGDNQTCALCPYEGDALMEHFSIPHVHDEFTPISLTDDMLNRLLQVNTENIKTFKLEQKIDYPRTTEKPEIFDQIEFVVCGCQSKINHVDYFDHIKNHRHNFNCSKCQFKAKSLTELVNHDKTHKMNSLNFRCLEFEDRLQKSYMNTNVVFKNGLVIAVRNLLNTKFDISEQFTEFVDTLVAIQKIEYNRLSECTEKKGFNETTDQRTVDEKKKVKKPDESPKLSRSILDEREAEMEKQNQLFNDVFIHGIPYSRDENLFRHIKVLFKKIRADVHSRDIELVTRPSKGKPIIIVRFTNHDAKGKVMACQSSVVLYSTDFVKRGRMMKVNISWNVTKYFANLYRLTKVYRKINHLSSYRWTKRGLFVQRTNESRGMYVFNEEELMDYIWNDRQKLSH